MKTLLLKRKGENFNCLIDDDIYELIKDSTWHVNDRGYVFSHKFGRLHRLVIKPKVGMLVDHIDHNTLNNQRANLREVTASQNQMNRNMNNVHYDSYGQNKNRYRGMIMVDRKKIHTKRCATYDEAKLLVDKLKDKYFGEYKYVN